MRSAVIHQPHLLPWLGYFNKLANCTSFVIMDNVQFRRRYFQNRTQILNMHGELHLLTLPVVANRNTLINGVKIARADKKYYKFLKTIEFSYSKSQYFSEYWNDLLTIFENNSNLLRLNTELIQYFLQLLNIKVEIYFSSDFSPLPHPTMQLLNICNKIKTNEYIVGEGNGCNYHNGFDLLTNQGITITKQKFLTNHPIYEQKGNYFIKKLSVIDSIFNIGKESTEKLVRESWTKK